MLGSANFVQYHQGKSEVTVRGQYEFEFIRNNDKQLRIMRIRMIPGSAIGNEKLLKEASKRSPTEKISYTVETVTFMSKDNKLMGWLLKPLNPKSRDVIVIGGPLMTVKEQVAYPYAKMFVEKGFPVFVFDSNGFGESEGSVRFQERPMTKMNDLLASVNYLTMRAEYEHSKINLIGVDVSAGYVSYVASAEPRISRLILVAPTFVQERSEDVLRSDYYVNLDRGGIPQWSTQTSVDSLKPFIGFDAIPAASQIRVPTLFIDSPEGLAGTGVKKFISMLRIRPEIKMLKGQHDDFYDQSTQMEFVVNRSMDFLNKEIVVEPLRQAQEE
jgi:hypothetical protein